MAKDVCLHCFEQEVEAYERGLKKAIEKNLSLRPEQYLGCAYHIYERQDSAWHRLFERLQLRLPFSGQSSLFPKQR